MKRGQTMRPVNGIGTPRGELNSRARIAAGSGAMAVAVVTLVALCAVLAGCASTTGARSSSPPSPPVTTQPKITTANAKPPWQTTPEQRQLCERLSWPRPMPAVVGLTLDTLGQGPQPLTCLDGTRLIGSNGQPFVIAVGDSAIYRVNGVAPQPGTPVGRFDPVTVHVVRVDSHEPAAYQPCSWVSTAEAAPLLGGSPVRTPVPHHVQAGSTDVNCDYDVEDHGGIDSELRTTAAHVVDAATEFDFVTSTAEGSPSDTSSSVSGIGIKAACTTVRVMTHPENVRYALYVLLPGERIYIATGTGGVSCDTLIQFANIAIPRIG
jgi:hypothetical protein